jgi:hypothetical protein
MGVRAKLVAIAAVACAWGCSRSGSAGGAGARQTRAFLEQVVNVRAQMSADDTYRIPAMLRREDAIMMTDQVVRIARYRQTLSKLDPAHVDPKVVRLQLGMEALLDAFRFVCLDSAELFTEVKELDSRQPERTPLAPAVLSAMRLSRGSTVAALDSLLDALGELDTSPRGGMDLAPIMASVRSDQAKLRRALEAQQDLARQVNAPPGS